MSEGGAIDVVRHPRARRIGLRFDTVTGRARLVLPRRVPLATGLAWAGRHADWIERQRAARPPARPFEPGAVVPVDGVPLTLVWDAAAGRTPRVADGCLVAGGPAEGFAARIERHLRRTALAVLSADTAHYAARAGVAVTRVGVGDTASRWGSCSSAGAIRYSWRLLLAPPWVRRATAAHEVAHRTHMDHSPAFHAHHAQLFGGDVRAARAWLRDHGATLHSYGRASGS